MIICNICKNEVDNKGMAAHIFKAHKIKSDEYVNLYGEFRPNKLKFQNRELKNNVVECGICK